QWKATSAPATAQTPSQVVGAISQEVLWPPQSLAVLGRSSSKARRVGPIHAAHSLSVHKAESDRRGLITPANHAETSTERKLDLLKSRHSQGHIMRDLPHNQSPGQ
ncbi:hypothetical protein LSH36_103g00036, partial [Paralvinella palmiformis]